MTVKPREKQFSENTFTTVFEPSSSIYDSINSPQAFLFQRVIPFLVTNVLLVGSSISFCSSTDGIVLCGKVQRLDRFETEFMGLKN